MCEFENKTLFFFGDSITNDGGFLTQMRGCLLKTENRVFLFNKGVGGARAGILRYLLEEELSFLKPDYAVLSYGVNDLGIWLYRNDRQLTEDDLLDKEKRIQEYRENVLLAVQALKRKNINPIICSPFCVNEQIVEREDIKTIGDNKEKTALIDDSFYKRATFHNINIGLGKLRDIARDIAQSEHVKFWDMYDYTLNNVSAGCFSSDGIHYTHKGNCVIANGLLSYMGFFDTSTESNNNPVLSEISTLENDMRAYFFIKYNLLETKNESISLDETKQRLSEYYKKNGYVNGLCEERMSGFLRFVENLEYNAELLANKINNF